MAFVLKTLKEKFPDVYDLLLNNQKEKPLIFLAPSGKIYAKDSLNDKSFYYHHIFQQSQFDSSLYTNFYGKVLKRIQEKTFITYLRWSRDMEINIIDENYNEDGLFFLQTDGICIETDSKVERIAGETSIQSIPLKKFETSEEYLKYYNEFDKPDYKNFQKGIKSMKSFIVTILNNYIFLKGYEENFSSILNENINKFITAFQIIFRDKSSIAQEFVDSYIFSNLYDKIMKKIDSFYFKEQKELKNKVDENINKFGIIELNLDSSLLNCNFDETYEKIKDLKNYKTYFEKIKCLIEINNYMLNEAKREYEKINNTKFEAQGDLLAGCWLHLLANYINKNDATHIYNEYLFFKYFRINKKYEQNDYILSNFISSIEMLQKELLSKDENQKIELVKAISFD